MPGWIVVPKDGHCVKLLQSKLNQTLSNCSHLMFTYVHTYTGEISENKIYTEKRVHKRCQLSNYYTEKYQFCVHSGKIYTGQKKFTPAPPVVPVTNIRYGYSMNHLLGHLIQLQLGYQVIN